MIVFWIVMVALVAALLYVLAAESRRRLEWLFKPAAALTFIVAGAYACPWTQAWHAALFVGLLFAAGGDVLLIPKSDRAFLGGLVSFLLGHVAYAVAFALRGLALDWFAVGAVAVVIAAVPVLRWLWPNVLGRMRGPVAAYIAVITAMVALAVGTYGARANVWLLGGAIGFYLSDLAVARDRFVQKSFTNRAWGLPLYFGAQLALATGMLEP